MIVVMLIMLMVAAIVSNGEQGGPGDAARVQMRMKCESVDHGVDGCGAGNGKLGTLLECRSGWWW